MKKTMLFILLTMLFPLNMIFAKGFVLTSPDLSGQLSNQQIFAGFGCHGENISPQLNWENPPEGTKSFAVTVYDPDAPTGSGWWHWLIFDIPQNTRMIKKNAGNPKAGLLPKESIQSITSFGQPGYGGACPPKDDLPHQYIFTVYALKVEKLGLKADTTPAMLGYYLSKNVLAKASIIVYYSR